MTVASVPAAGSPQTGQDLLEPVSSESHVTHRSIAFTDYYGTACSSESVRAPIDRQKA